MGLKTIIIVLLIGVSAFVMYRGGSFVLGQPVEHVKAEERVKPFCTVHKPGHPTETHYDRSVCYYEESEGAEVTYFE